MPQDIVPQGKPEKWSRPRGRQRFIEEHPVAPGKFDPWAVWEDPDYAQLQQVPEIPDEWIMSEVRMALWMVYHAILDRMADQNPEYSEGGLLSKREKRPIQKSSPGGFYYPEGFEPLDDVVDAKALLNHFKRFRDFMQQKSMRTVAPAAPSPAAPALPWPRTQGTSGVTVRVAWPFGGGKGL